MYFDLDNMDIEIKSKRHFSTGMVFSYKGENYYYKTHKLLDNMYNEILAKKIADKLNVDCCEYYLGCYFEGLGSISKMFPKDNYFSMSDLLLSTYGITKNKNNLKDINNMLDKMFSKDVAERLREELLDIFLFDVLIGNCDRNTDNYGLIIDDNPRFAPLFDNENMLSDYSIYSGSYTLGIDEYDTDDENILYKLLDDNEEAKYKLKMMLPIISDDSLEEIFKELESNYEVNPYIKEKILDRFSINRGMIIERVSSKVKRIDRRRLNE